MLAEGSMHTVMNWELGFSKISFALSNAPSLVHHDVLLKGSDEMTSGMSPRHPTDSDVMIATKSTADVKTLCTWKALRRNGIRPARSDINDVMS